MTKPCRIPGCPRPAYRRRTVCNHHAMAAHRYGHPLAGPSPRERVELTCRRFGTLVALTRCEERQGWLCLCDCGAATIVRTWSLTSGETRTCGDRPAHMPAATSYRQAHAHTAAIRGPATLHACVRCGLPAAQWAFNRADHKDARTAFEGPWSPDPDDYLPLCVPCHKRSDLTAIAETAAAQHGARPLPGV